MVIIKQYLQITKPGIICGNLISTIGSFLMAAKGQINYVLFFNTLISVVLIVASSCVYNNYIDRDIDQRMERTKNRPIAKGVISLKISLIYATILGIIGFTILYLEVNSLATLLGLVGFVIYVGVYTLYMKRKSVYGILIGSFSGAIPPIIGYCAVIDQFDIGALNII